MALAWPPRHGSALTALSPHGVCQPSGSASSGFSEQQLGFFPSFGPSCHHPQGSGGEGVVRCDAEAPRLTVPALSLHPALLTEHHHVLYSHSSACCYISGVTAAPRPGALTMRYDCASC